MFQISLGASSRNLALFQKIHDLYNLKFTGMVFDP